MSEAFAVDREGHDLRILKGAFSAVAEIAETSDGARHLVDELAGQGHRVIAVAAGPPHAPRLVGLIALGDAPRGDAADLVTALRDLGVRTMMVTGDSAATAAAIAGKVGIAGAVCPPERFSDDHGADEYGVFARVLPEDKLRLVKSLQHSGRVVGMCGDGANDAPALRQAQIGIAVASATDVAKTAAGMVLTEPGLGGIVNAVREGRIAFQRLRTYALNMLVKKIEIVLFLAIGVVLTSHALLTPLLMVMMMVTNDFLSISLTTDRATPARSPTKWRARNATFAAALLALCKLGFSTAIVSFGKFQLGLGVAQLQTLAFVTLVFGNQALLYVVRERRRMWSSPPSRWVVAASAVDIAIVSSFALTGTMMDALPWRLMLGILAAAAGFALILDQVKLPLLRRFDAG